MTTYVPSSESPPLVATGRHSFTCSPHELNALCSWLLQLGYSEKQPTSRHEWARLVDRGALIVIYRSGSIIAQGSEAERASQLLRRASIEQATLPVIWQEGGVQ